MRFADFRCFSVACLISAAAWLTSATSEAAVIVGSVHEGFSERQIGSSVYDFRIGTGAAQQLLVRMTVLPAANAIRFEQRSPWDVRADSGPISFLHLAQANQQITTMGNGFISALGGNPTIEAIVSSVNVGPGVNNLDHVYAGFFSHATSNAVWVELSYNTIANLLTIHDYAYTTAGEGASFRTGAVSAVLAVPEPSSLAAFGLLALGLVARRYRVRVC